MSASSADDELLAILLTNLRNAAATFGEGTPPYESIRSTVEEHLNAMKACGRKTNLSNARNIQGTTTVSDSPQNGPLQPIAKSTLTFSNLAFRPRPSA